MTTLVLTGLVSCASALSGWCGYLLRGRVEDRRANEREHVVNALGGKLPHWEARAREIEDRADEQEITGQHSSAESGRRMAATIRRLGRQRDRRNRNWRP